MARIDELLDELLKTNGGTPRELAEVLGVDSNDRTFQRALQTAVEQGIFAVDGSTRDRVYRRPLSEYELVDEQIMALVKNGPILAREFTDELLALGLEGKDAAERKLSLEIETFKSDDGRWYCRHTPGYRFEGVSAEQRREAVRRRTAGMQASTVLPHVMSFAMPKEKKS